MKSWSISKTLARSLRGIATSAIYEAQRSGVREVGPQEPAGRGGYRQDYPWRNACPAFRGCKQDKRGYREGQRLLRNNLFKLVYYSNKSLTTIPRTIEALHWESAIAAHRNAGRSEVGAVRSFTSSQTSADQIQERQRRIRGAYRKPHSSTVSRIMSPTVRRWKRPSTASRR